MIAAVSLRLLCSPSRTDLTAGPLVLRIDLLSCFAVSRLLVAGSTGRGDTPEELPYQRWRGA
jgi:hypothetical protein